MKIFSKVQWYQNNVCYTCPTYSTPVNMYWCDLCTEHFIRLYIFLYVGYVGAFYSYTNQMWSVLTMATGNKRQCQTMYGQICVCVCKSNVPLHIYATCYIFLEMLVDTAIPKNVCVVLNMVTCRDAF